MSENTIAAISSPLGEGGIGVIRISGENAIAVADASFCAVSGKKLSSLKGYSAAFGNVVLADGSPLDEAVALVFRAPKSYTGEDVVEISVHGGLEIQKQALRRITECGASLAEAGEFTKRAFLNGKMPLSKAESVMALISAKGEAALAISRAAAGGSIDRAVKEIIELLKETAAGISAYSDFPDEELVGARPCDFEKLLKKVSGKLLTLIKNYDTGKLIREGIDCAIVGKPNVGKSTLMNLLSGNERSIVTEIPGTTRDIIESAVQIEDLTLNLSDTAGIRLTDDVVEAAGVDRAKKKIENASLILALFDGSKEVDSDDKLLLSSLKDKPVVIIINKTDLKQKISPNIFDGFPVVYMSAKEKTGVGDLVKTIKEVCKISHLSNNDAVLINERQLSCVKAAYKSVKDAECDLASGMTVDAVGVLIDDALEQLFTLTGERVTEAVCDEIFKRFCVGK
ncbi:MAG: tRNA uridine-5-carboxymethylaminomethyl(34) synthesis GTPase MnmE [Clostridia bacterium]|nr:tRNA uridine-5-carboxymethylaminomethyl(34) synthesis GTPase MnmE [Clostridia bacterium]